MVIPAGRWFVLPRMLGVLAAVIGVLSAAPSVLAARPSAESNAVLATAAARAEARFELMRNRIQLIHTEMDFAVTLALANGRSEASVRLIVLRAAKKAEREAAAMRRDVFKETRRARRALARIADGSLWLSSLDRLDESAHFRALEVEAVLPEAWLEWLEQYPIRS